MNSAVTMDMDALCHAARDIGRHIAPGFVNFQAVNQFENSLAKQHPEYF